MPVWLAVSTPLRVLGGTARHFSHEPSRVDITPVPRVSVRIRLRRPISARVGAMYVSRAPLPASVRIVCSCAPREPRASVMAPTASRLQSMMHSSIGSWRSPLISRVMTAGRDTSNSYPSRRIVSIRMARCSSPRPLTSKMSAVAPSATVRATLVCSSRSRRARRWAAPELARRAAGGGLAAGEGRLVDRELHPQGRLAHLQPLQRLRMLGIRDRIPDRDIGEASDIDDLARRRGFGGPPLQGFDREQRRDPLALAGARLADPDYILAGSQRAARDPPNGQPADVIVMVQVAHHQLQRAVRVTQRWWDVGQQCIEERLEGRPRVGAVDPGRPP